MTGNTLQLLYPSLSTGFLVSRFSHPGSSKTPVSDPHGRISTGSPCQGNFHTCICKELILITPAVLLLCATGAVPPSLEGPEIRGGFTLATGSGEVFFGSGCRATKQAEPASGHCISQEVGSKRRMLLQGSTGCSYRLWPVMLKLGEVWKSMCYLYWSHLPGPAAAPHYQQDLTISSSPLTHN